MTVELQVVPQDAQHLVVIGSPVRKPVSILAPFLQSLAWQQAPANVQRFYVFINDGCEPDAKALLEQFVAQHGGMVWDGEPGPSGDFRDDAATHLWTDSSMGRVGRAKDRILQFAVANRAEAVWLIDADLICDPMTFASLWSVPDLITSAVYWTRWNKVPEGCPPIHAGPQVWLNHPYGLAGDGMEEWEFRRRLVTRQLTRVFGLGACTLIRREALLRGVSFAPWPANTLPGIGQGEDRHFCMRAEALHIRMMADPWPDIFHIYHRPEDERRVPEILKRLSRPPHITMVVIDGGPPSPTEWDPATPVLGDLVSLNLTALEPIPTHQGWMNPPPQLVRGRLGQLPLHPELEDAILDMTRGEQRIVPVHFGLDYPLAPYRGQRRIIRIELLDHKPMGYAPVIEDEMLVNRAGRGIDQTTCPPELLDQIQEVNA